jgi:hypothetical protein
VVFTAVPSKEAIVLRVIPKGISGRGLPSKTLSVMMMARNEMRLIVMLVISQNHQRLLMRRNGFGWNVERREIPLNFVSILSMGEYDMRGGKRGDQERRETQMKRRIECKLDFFYFKVSKEGSAPKDSKISRNLSAARALLAVEV